MRISKARLKQIINEEVQNYKRRVYENEFAGLPFDDDGEEEHEQVAIEKKRMMDSIEELLIHINPQQVVQHLQSLAAQVKQGKISEDMPVRTTYSSDPELDQIVDIARTVVERGGGLFDIKQPLEAEGFDVDATSRFTIINTSNGKIAIASVNNVELSGDEELIDTQHGQLAVGRI